MKKKWEMNCYSFYDISGMEKHFEKMARKGWALEKVSTYGLVYRKCEPMEARYAVLYTPSHSNFDPGPDEQQEALTEMSAYDGWTLAAQQDQMMVYWNQDTQAVDMDTDAVAQVGGLEKMAKKLLGLWWTCLIFLALFLHFHWMAVRHNPIIFLSQGLRIVVLVLAVLLLIYFAAELIGWYRWKKKAEIMAEEQGEFLKTRGNDVLLRIVLAAALLGLAYILVTVSPAIGLNLLFFGLAWVVTVPLVNGLRRHLQKRGTAWHMNVFITVVLLLVIYQLIRLGCGFVMKDLSISTAPEPVLTLEMLTGKGSTDRTYSFQTSGFVTRAEYREDGIGSDFSYVAVDIHLPFLWDMCQEEMMNRYDGWGGRWEYQETDSTPWQAEEAWQLCRNDQAQEIYLLRWGDRLVEVNFPSGFDQAQRETVYETFGR